MGIKEIILDAIINTKIFELAKNRSDLIRSISDYDWQIDNNLLKILIYGKVADYENWCSETNDWLLTIQRMSLKHSKKRLNQDVYLKLLWEGFLETEYEIQAHVSSIDKKYSSSYKIVNSDSSKIHKKIYEILFNVCHDLSLGKFNDIRNYL